MGDLTKNFSRWEFRCKCGCGADTVDFELLTILQFLRDDLESPVTINSGHRCPAHNARVGGAPSSQHLYSKAADIVTKLSPLELFNFLDTLYSHKFGIGIYSSGFVHFDVRPTKARW